MGPGCHPSFEQRDLAFRQCRYQVGVLAVFPDVRHTPDFHPQVEEIDGGFQTRIVAHGKNRLAARQHPVGAGQTMGTTHLHDAGALVVFENQRAFDAAGGHHDAVRADLYITLGEGMAGPAHLKGGDEVVGVGTHHGRVLEYPDIAGFLHLPGHLP